MEGPIWGAHCDCGPGPHVMSPKAALPRHVHLHVSCSQSFPILFRGKDARTGGRAPVRPPERAWASTML